MKDFKNVDWGKYGIHAEIDFAGVNVKSEIFKTNGEKSLKQFVFNLAVMCYNKTTRSDGTFETRPRDFYLSLPLLSCTQTGNVISASWEVQVRTPSYRYGHLYPGKQQYGYIYYYRQRNRC